MFDCLKSDRGVATLIALLMVAMLTLIGLAALSTSEDEIQIAGNELQEMRAFYAAEAGLERASAALQSEYDSTGAPPTVLPVGKIELNDCTVHYLVRDDGPAVSKVLSSGALTGLHALTKSFSVTSTASSSVDNASILMEENFEVSLVPIFQFAVFYENDLEIAPGPDMNLCGRVHTNSDLYIQAGSTLKMDSYVTAAGDIRHGYKDGSESSGDVLIRDAFGNHVSMKMGSDWLDADYADWYDSSLGRWGGRVKDRSHGQKSLRVPLTEGTDPRSLIERGNDDSFENKATLTIVDGVALRKMEDGNWQDVTAAMVADGVLTYAADQFVDQREGTAVNVTDLDIGKMYDGGYAPINGVTYFSNEISSAGDWPALRLVNGAELDDRLTIASENPIYTLGDFNSSNKKSVSLMADAITFLSNAWVDSLSSSTVSDRQAVETTVNASYITGNVATTGTDYSGGFENLPRFLETWSDVNFNWSGSAVNLWYSRQANASWNGFYYWPPNRNWQFDTDLDDPNNLPPETPVVRVFQRVGWQQQFVGYGFSSTEITDSASAL